MSIRNGQAVVLAALLAGALAAQADDKAPDASLDAPQRASVTLASQAAKEGARRAIESISADQAVKLDVRLSGLTSEVRRAAPVTVAAN